MPLQNLNQFYQSKGYDETKRLLTNTCLITERFSSVSFYVKTSDDGLKFYKKDGRQEISHVDRTLNRLYEDAVSHFENITFLPENWKFNFDYFPTQSPARIKYDKLPHNNLILNRIFVTNENGKTKKVIEDPKVLGRWANKLDVDFNRPLTYGKLTVEQVDAFLEVLETENVLLPDMICKRVFLRTPKLSENFGSIDSILLRFYTDPKKPEIFEVTSKMDIVSINESKDKTDKASLLLVDFMDFMRSKNLQSENLKNKEADRRYVELMGDIFEDYVNRRKSLEIDLTSDKFSNNVFELNADLIEKVSVRELMKNENYQRAFQIILNSFRKPRTVSESNPLFDENTINDFNNLVERISKITKFVEEKDFITFEDYMEMKKMNESMIIEKKKFLTIFEKLSVLGLNPKVTYKHGKKHIRAAIKSSVDETTDYLKENINGSFAIVNTAPDDWKGGCLSGKYHTFSLVFENEQVDIVNQKTESGLLKPKELTPSVLGLPLDETVSLDELKQTVIDRIQERYYGDLKNFLISLVEETYLTNIQDKYNTLSETGEISNEIFYSEKTKKFLENISSTDLANIGKDFGEVLGAIYFARLTESNDGIKFPSGNNPLVDFMINEHHISSKYKNGATATLTGIIEMINESSVDDSLRDLFSVVTSHGVAESYLKLAEHLNLPGYLELEQIIGEDLTLESINSFVSNLHVEDDQQTESNIIETFSSFYQTINRGVASPLKLDKVQEDKRYGYVIGPLSYHVADSLNEMNEYTDSLKKLLGTYDIKQLYLDINKSKGFMKFVMKPFANDENRFVFTAPNQSVYNPGNGRLGFALK